jgi:predicted permease
MKRLLVTSVIVGAIAGLLWGGFNNIFTVPVMERAIVLEEERAAAETLPAPTAAEEPSTDVSLGLQRIGFALGTAGYGAIFGLFFAAGFVLLHRAAPNWPIIWVALTVGALGFWSISLFPFIKYPLNPPGVGDEGTLLARQLGQTLFMLISGAAVAVAIDLFRRVNENIAEFSSRRTWYGLTLVIYVVLAVVMVLVFPGNPDPVPVPIDLLELFRTLTMIGHFITWALLAVGVALALMWHQRTEEDRSRETSPAASGVAR